MTRTTEEGRLKELVKKRLKALNFWYFFPVAGRSTGGIPDIIGCTPKGHFFAIEVKATGGKLTPLQSKALREIEEHGGFVFVVWPHNIHELDYFLTILQ